ncbi:MAG TPA: antibiotic biosynthesis monooxygenase [Longimicrobiales bacterium]|nr:antibiotic biosynthesis monooxygenase [Longimicrobiales bacterium]
MVMTVLEAQVLPDRVMELEEAYREGTSEIPPEIVETFLVREMGEPARFRIVTVWTSRDALDAMRQSGVTPRGVQIFQSIGAAPVLSVHDVVVHQRR